MKKIPCMVCKKENTPDCFYGKAINKMCIACRYISRGKKPVEKRVRLTETERINSLAGKECSKCRIIKSFSCFYRDGRSSDGHIGMCVTCYDQYMGREPKHAVSHRSKLRSLEGLKECGRCFTMLPHEKFWKSKYSKNGIQSRCKECMKIGYLNWYKSQAGVRDRIRREDKIRRTAIEVGSRNWWQRKFLKKKHWPHWTRLLAMFESSNKCCEYCGVDVKPGSLVFDHKMPKSRGGSNELENMAIACAPCNRLKWDMTDTEFRFFLKAYTERLTTRNSLRLVQNG